MVRLVRGPKYAAGHWATDSESLTRGAPPRDGRALAVDLWWFLFFGGGVPFSLAAGSFEPTAARQPASEYAATECWVSLPMDTEDRNGEFSWRCMDTLEALIVVHRSCSGVQYDDFNYHSPPGLGETRRGLSRPR